MQIRMSESTLNNLKIAVNDLRKNGYRASIADYGFKNIETSLELIIELGYGYKVSEVGKIAKILKLHDVDYYAKHPDFLVSICGEAWGKNLVY